MKRILTLIFSLSTFILSSQNECDLGIHDMIYPTLYIDCELAETEILKTKERYNSIYIFDIRKIYLEEQFSIPFPNLYFTNNTKAVFN